MLCVRLAPLRCSPERLSAPPERVERWTSMKVERSDLDGRPARLVLACRSRSRYCYVTWPANRGAEIIGGTRSFAISARRCGGSIAFLLYSSGRWICAESTTLQVDDERRTPGPSQGTSLPPLRGPPWYIAETDDAAMTQRISDRVHRGAVTGLWTALRLEASRRWGEADYDLLYGSSDWLSFLWWLMSVCAGADRPADGRGDRRAAGCRGCGW